MRLGGAISQHQLESASPQTFCGGYTLSDTPGILTMGTPTVVLDCAKISTSTFEFRFHVRIEEAHVWTAARTRVGTNLSADIIATYKNFRLGWSFCFTLPLS